MGQSAARKKHKTKQKKAQNKNIDSKRFSRKQKATQDYVPLLETLHITPRRHLFHTSCYFVTNSNFFATIVPRYNKHATASQKYEQRLHFLPPSTL